MKKKFVYIILIIFVLLIIWVSFIYILFFKKSHLTNIENIYQKTTSLLDINWIDYAYSGNVIISWNEIWYEIWDNIWEKNNYDIDFQTIIPKIKKSKTISSIKTSIDENIYEIWTNSKENTKEETDNIKTSLTDRIKSIQQKPYNINWYYFGIIYATGIEKQWWLELTDIIKLIVYNENTHNLIIIWIPRDRVIDFNWEKMKINYIFNKLKKSWYSHKQALEKLTNLLSSFLNTPINYYVMIDFDVFKEFVDLIWWIDLCINDEIYEDKHPLLEEWCYKLDWELALTVSRSRYHKNDFFRSLRQNHIIYSLIDKIKSLSLIDKFKITKLLLQKINTNLNIGEIIYWVNNLLNFNKKISIVLNSECNFYDWKFSEDLLFCLFKKWYDKEFFLYPIKDIETIRHYIKTIIYHPNIYNCEFQWKFNYKEKINLLNVWVRIKKHKFIAWFEIDNLSGCSYDDINYFINM